MSLSGGGRRPGEEERRLDGAPGEDAPFTETRAGGLFFLNAVLSGPTLLVLWPVLVRGVLRGIGALEGPSGLWDPVPAVAGALAPFIAWLSAIPLATCLYNLRMPLPTPARWTLRGFVAVHAAVLAWWVIERLL